MQYFGTKHTAKIQKQPSLQHRQWFSTLVFLDQFQNFHSNPSIEKKQKTMCKLSKPSAVITQTSGQAQRPMTKVNQSNEIKHISYYLDATIWAAHVKLYIFVFILPISAVFLCHTRHDSSEVLSVLRVS